MIIGNPVLISNNTADGTSDALAITSGIDSTYDQYMFVLYYIHVATDDAWLGFQFDVGTATAYAQNITSSNYKAFNTYAGSGAVQNQPDSALHTESTYQSIVATAQGMSNQANSSMAAILHLVAPSNTSFLTNFYSQSSWLYYTPANYEMAATVEGQILTTTAITRINFKTSSGNFSGNIDMYGVA